MMRAFWKGFRSRDAEPARSTVREDSSPVEVVKEPPMEIVGRVFTPSEFVRYVEELDFPEPLPTTLFLHHTWRPTVDSWQGMDTILAMKAYYERQIWEDEEGHLHEGWNAGPHLFVAPDGIWVFSDLRYDGVGVRGHNTGTRHLEMVGNYDECLPSGAILEGTVAALGVLFDRLNLDPTQLAFHRDFSTKTCPGSQVQKEWIIPQIQSWMSAYREEKARRTPGARGVLVAMIQDLLLATNSSTALSKAAAARGLLGAITHEVPLEIDERQYVVQIFAEALLVPADQWDAVQSLGELESSNASSELPTTTPTRLVNGQVRELAMPPFDSRPFSGKIR